MAGGRWLGLAIREPWAEAITKQHEQTEDDVRAQLELLDERRFRNGVVHLQYRVSV